MTVSGENARLHVVVGLGPIGLAVVDELLGRGLRTRGVARHRPADLSRAAEFVEADITHEDHAQSALEGASVVYHSASAPYHRWPQLLPPIMRASSREPAPRAPASCMPTTSTRTVR